MGKTEETERETWERRGVRDRARHHAVTMALRLPSSGSEEGERRGASLWLSG
jgi:hypothetical protein